MDANIEKRPRLVVLGAGFGAFRLLKSIDTSAYEVFVVSPRNYFLFTPLLASTAVGTIEFRSIVEPIRLAGQSFEYYQAACTAIDTERRVAVCESVSSKERFEVPYDYLVIAVGAATNTFGIPGVEKHCLFLKDIPDARAIRSRIVECFERANEPGLSEAARRDELHFIIVGGGPTGVEFAAELHDLVTEDFKKRYPALLPLFQITVLEAGKRLLNTFDEALSAYAARTFTRQNIEVRMGALVTAVEEDAVRLKEGGVIRAGLIVWSAGISAAPFVHSLPFAKQGWQLVTDGFLKVAEDPHVYAIGDCAVIAGKGYAPTAQLAQQQGKYLAKALKQLARGKPVKPFRFLNMGMLAYVGSGRALMNTPGFKGRGFIAWLFWRSIYITKLVSLRNKVSVLFDWLRTFFFGRDFSKF